MLRLSLIALLLCGTVAHAEIYKCVDKSGHITYSNVPIKCWDRTVLPIADNQPPQAAPATRRARPQPGNNAGSPAIPSVDSGTQRNRDEGRRRILQSELDNEKQALAEARNALAEYSKKAGNNAAQLQRMRDAVTDRERNISALNQELGNTRTGK